MDRGEGEVGCRLSVVRVDDLKVEKLKDWKILFSRDQLVPKREDYQNSSPSFFCHECTNDFLDIYFYSNDHRWWSNSLIAFIDLNNSCIRGKNFPLPTSNPKLTAVLSILLSFWLYNFMTYSIPQNTCKTTEWSQCLSSNWRCQNVRWANEWRHYPSQSP